MNRTIMTPETKNKEGYGHMGRSADPVDRNKKMNNVE